MEDSLLYLYFSYKQATKVILDWLVSTVGHGHFCHSRLTTTETVDAATFVREQKLAVPEYVLSKFREVLFKRRAVHFLYVERCGSGYDEENLKHKAFIDRWNTFSTEKAAWNRGLTELKDLSRHTKYFYLLQHCRIHLQFQPASKRRIYHLSWLQTDTHAWWVWASWTVLLAGMRECNGRTQT